RRREHGLEVRVCPGRAETRRAECRALLFSLRRPVVRHSGVGYPWQLREVVRRVGEEAEIAQSFFLLRVVERRRRFGLRAVGRRLGVERLLLFVEQSRLGLIFLIAHRTPPSRSGLTSRRAAISLPESV